MRVVSGPLAWALFLTALVPASAGSSLDDRVKDQEAIERVYWAHRLWPKENPLPKPPLEAVLRRSAIRSKVVDTLEKSKALETIWHRPITAAQLQAELDRMASQTRDPRMLRELFAALDDDPQRIAETLARQELADRLLRSAFESDRRFHSRPFDAWWAEHRDTLGVDVKDVAAPFSFTMPDVSGCTTDTWLETLRTAVPDPRGYHSAVWTGSEMIVWGGHDFIALAGGGRYDPATDTWEAMPAGPAALAARREHTAVWTGTQMIVWGGYDGTTYFKDGARFDPATGLWSATSTGANVPSARDEHTAVWTGTQMIVWGGAGVAGSTNSGGRYNPASDTWSATSTGANVPTARSTHTAVWTGSTMIVWGGITGVGANAGGRYDPATDTWAAISTGPNAPFLRSNHSAVWTGTEMIVWGGHVATNTGGRYNPTTDTWLPTSTGANVPSARESHAAVWTGSLMIVWGGSGGATGGRYDPATDTWTPVTTANAPGVRTNNFTAVWTGTEMIVWGGYDSSVGAYLNTGGRYDPAADSWAATSRSGLGPSARYNHTAVWTGAEVIVWGGTDGSALSTGSRFNPATNSWAPTSTGAGIPAARYNHTAVWTGSAMVVWGGWDGTTGFNTGARYDPAADTWTATSVANAPVVRREHVAVWTGTEMIVWGGFTTGSYTNTGGRYNPATDAWTATSTGSNVPSGRIRGSGVWTGTELIVWGGFNNTSTYMNTGGRYSPAVDSWLATSTGTNVPTTRYYHTAVWTGSRMIVWGGFNGTTSMVNTGAQYDPATDTWTPTSTGTNVPVPRFIHTAVWTGAQMIVWGGSAAAGSTNTGGRYDPSNDTWAPTSTGAGDPTPRTFNSATWVGSKMMLFGGQPPISSGGLYCDCEGIAAPSGSPSLTESTAGETSTLTWTPISGAAGYDIVMGSLGTLRSTGGDYAASVTACLANDAPATSQSDASPPDSGGTWYLVRPVNPCGGAGSYDEGSPSQSGTRDAEIAMSASSCP